MFFQRALRARIERNVARAPLAARFLEDADADRIVEPARPGAGRIEEADEFIVIFKTRAELFSCVEARIKELHSHKTPCIAALPVTAGHMPYLDWVLAETKI